MNIRTYYFRDPKNSGRVLTLVIRKDSDTKVSYGWALCRPNVYETDIVKYSKYHQMRVCVERGDTFTRKMGRKIALGRLEQKPQSIFLGSVTPLMAVLSDLEVHPESPSIRRIAEKEIHFLRTLDNARKLKSVIAGPTAES